VDSFSYVGFTPPTAFDPLLAKLICSGGRAGGGDAFDAVLRRTLRALGEFCIEGVETNLATLAAILNHPTFVGNTATTTFLEQEGRGLLSIPTTITSGGKSPTEELLRSGISVAAQNLGFTAANGSGVATSFEGDECVEGSVVATLAGSVIELPVGVGQAVAAGDVVAILSAMKMESQLEATEAGVVSMIRVKEGAQVELGEVILVIDTSGAGAGSGENGSGENVSGENVVQKKVQDWGPEIEELNKRRAMVSAMGGEESIAKHHANGKLTVRERVASLVDGGVYDAGTKPTHDLRNSSFRELGALAARYEYDPETGELLGMTAPSNCVVGHAKLRGRRVVVSGDDFTVRGGSAEGSIGDKRGYIERMSREMRVPIIRLLDGNSGGGSVGLYSSGKGVGGGTVSAALWPYLPSHCFGSLLLHNLTSG
jgi:biotin carboxyl carrier protein